MGKKNRQPQGNRAPTSPPPARPPAGPVPPNPAIAATVEGKITEVAKRAGDVATMADIDAIAPRPMPVGTTIHDLWKVVDEAEQLYKSAAKRFTDESTLFESKQAALTVRDEALTARQDAAREQAAAVEKREKRLDADAVKAAALDRDLAQREQQLRVGEADAVAGFAKRNREATQALAEQIQALADEHATLQQRLASLAAEQAQASEAVWAAARSKAEAAIANERAAFQTERDSHVTAQRTLETELRKLQWERDDVAAERASLSERAKQLAVTEIAAAKAGVELLEAEIAALRTQRDDLDARLRVADGSARRFAGKTDTEIEKVIADLNSERDQLVAQLATRPNRDVVEENKRLQAERDTFKGDLDGLRRNHEVVRVQLLRAETGVAELEALRDQCLSLKKSNELLHAANDQLRQDIDQRIRSTDGSSPFPACVKMDNGGDDETIPLNSHRQLDDRPVLPELIDRIQRQAATDDEPLYYDVSDIRAFVAGMAMTRLTLLQGPSGTGKTSLPVVVARALGGLATVIPAESGWNDPADLIGNFNQFDHRFDERPFLQALYRAGTPYYSDVPVFIVVDEMNLSHPEQYFSPVLSMIEARSKVDRRFELVPVADTGAPHRFLEGRFLGLPPNVWFIGTANRDETTKDFADKTYDRSLVMELPVQPRAFSAERPDPQQDPYSAAGLHAAFDLARKRYADEADRAWAFIEGELKGTMAENFGVGWGPRLRRQTRAFVPAMIAAGGTLGEALDHLIAMRILRKIRERHTNRPEDLDVIRKVLEKPWTSVAGKVPAMRSLSEIDVEQRRIERDLR